MKQSSVCMFNTLDSWINFLSNAAYTTLQYLDKNRSEVRKMQVNEGIHSINETIGSNIYRQKHIPNRYRQQLPYESEKSKAFVQIFGRKECHFQIILMVIINDSWCFICWCRATFFFCRCCLIMASKIIIANDYSVTVLTFSTIKFLHTFLFRFFLRISYPK